MSRKTNKAELATSVHNTFGRKTVSDIETHKLTTNCQGGEQVPWWIISVQLNTLIPGTSDRMLKLAVAVKGSNGTALTEVELDGPEEPKLLEESHIKPMVDTQCAQAGCNNGEFCKLRAARLKK